MSDLRLPAVGARAAGVIRRAEGRRLACSQDAAEAPQDTLLPEDFHDAHSTLLICDTLGAAVPTPVAADPLATVTPQEPS